MKLYDEEELRIKNERSKKIKNLILVGIICSVVLIVLLIGSIYYLIYNPNKITILLDGKESEEIENMIYPRTSEDGSTTVYFPIRQIANILGYSSYNGDYRINVENSENCYAESENEVVIFTENSNILYKIDKTNTNQQENLDFEYEEVKMDNFVIKENDILYIDLDGLANAFNLDIVTNKKMKKISIRTLEKLITLAEKIVTSNRLGVLDEKYINRKAILDNMIVIESSNDGKKGVINYSTKEEILGFQYDDITYIPTANSFLIKKDDKVGIIGSDRILKIKPQYDKLTLIDNINGLFLAEDNGTYGIIDENGNIKIYLEYDKIGVDINEFKENGLKNGYVLLGNIIPVRKDGKWMFFKIENIANSNGSNNVQCTKLEIGDFENIGCKSTKTGGTISNLMVIEDYNVVLVQKYGIYGFISSDGRTASALKYKDAYIETVNGVKEYYMEDTDGNIIRVIDELEKNGFSKVN